MSLLSLGRYLPKAGQAAKGTGITSRLSGGLSRFGSGLSSVLKTSGGGLVGGGVAGYSVASLEQWTGGQDETRKLLVIGGAILLAMYSAGQLFDIQLGGN